MSPTSMSMISSQSYSAQLISPNNQNHQMMINSSQNGNLVPHSQSAHQLGHQQQQQQQQQHVTLPQQPHQMLQQQLQKHFQHNNMGELESFFVHSNAFKLVISW
jgi:hypothetical protein